MAKISASIASIHARRCSEMLCLAELILTFGLLPVPSGAPVLTLLLFVAWLVQRARPCGPCLLVFYAVLVLATLSSWEDRTTGGGLFDALRISPETIELNLLLHLKYDMQRGLFQCPTTGAFVWEPATRVDNFVKAFISFLVYPSYGAIHQT